MSVAKDVEMHFPTTQLVTENIAAIVNENAAVVDAACESHLWWSKRVGARKDDRKEEDRARVRRALRSHDHRLPIVQVVVVLGSRPNVRIQWKFAPLLRYAPFEARSVGDACAR